MASRNGITSTTSTRNILEHATALKSEPYIGRGKWGGAFRVHLLDCKDPIIVSTFRIGSHRKSFGVFDPYDYIELASHVNVFGDTF